MESVAPAQDRRLRPRGRRIQPGKGHRTVHDIDSRQILGRVTGHTYVNLYFHGTGQSRFMASRVHRRNRILVNARLQIRILVGQAFHGIHHQAVAVHPVTQGSIVRLRGFPSQTGRRIIHHIHRQVQRLGILRMAIHRQSKIVFQDIQARIHAGRHLDMTLVAVQQIRCIDMVIQSIIPVGRNLDPHRVQREPARQLVHVQDKGQARIGNNRAHQHEMPVHVIGAAEQTRTPGRNPGSPMHIARQLFASISVVFCHLKGLQVHAADDSLIVRIGNILPLRLVDDPQGRPVREIRVVGRTGNGSVDLGLRLHDRTVPANQGQAVHSPAPEGILPGIVGDMLQFRDRRGNLPDQAIPGRTGEIQDVNIVVPGGHIEIQAVERHGVILPDMKVRHERLDEVPFPVVFPDVGIALVSHIEIFPVEADGSLRQIRRPEGKEVFHRRFQTGNALGILETETRQGRAVARVVEHDAALRSGLDRKADRTGSLRQADFRVHHRHIHRIASLDYLHRVPVDVGTRQIHPQSIRTGIHVRQVVCPACFRNRRIDIVILAGESQRGTLGSGSVGGHRPVNRGLGLFIDFHIADEPAYHVHGILAPATETDLEFLARHIPGNIAIDTLVTEIALQRIMLGHGPPARAIVDLRAQALHRHRFGRRHKEIPRHIVAEHDRIQAGRIQFFGNQTEIIIIGQTYPGAAGSRRIHQASVHPVHIPIAIRTRRIQYPEILLQTVAVEILHERKLVYIGDFHFQRGGTRRNPVFVNRFQRVFVRTVIGYRVGIAVFRNQGTVQLDIVPVEIVPQQVVVVRLGRHQLVGPDRDIVDAKHEPAICHAIDSHILGIGRKLVLKIIQIRMRLGTARHGYRIPVVLPDERIRHHVGGGVPYPDLLQTVTGIKRGRPESQGNRIGKTVGSQIRADDPVVPLVADGGKGHQHLFAGMRHASRPVIDRHHPVGIPYHEGRRVPPPVPLVISNPVGFIVVHVHILPPHFPGRIDGERLMALEIIEETVHRFRAFPVQDHHLVRHADQNRSLRRRVRLLGMPPTGKPAKEQACQKNSEFLHFLSFFTRYATFPEEKSKAPSGKVFQIPE